jgi:hypothetical protein
VFIDGVLRHDRNAPRQTSDFSVGTSQRQEKQ